MAYAYVYTVIPSLKTRIGPVVTGPIYVAAVGFANAALVRPGLGEGSAGRVVILLSGIRYFPTTHGLLFVFLALTSEDLRHRYKMSNPGDGLVRETA